MTVQNVQEVIDRLEGLNPQDSYAYEKALHAYMSVRQLPFLILEITEPFHVFRTRTHSTDNFFCEISDIAIPPAPLVNSFARCNRPFQPIFYCSDFRPTSYSELVEYWAEGKKIGDLIYVTISKWLLSKPIKTLIITSPNPADRTSPYDKAHGDAIDHFINQYQRDYKDAMILFYNYLFTKFRKPAKNDPKTYLITSAYCSLAFTKANGNLDAIFYPSVPFRGEGVNFAISGNFDFNSNFDPVLVARNMFTITDFKPEPVFTETQFIQANFINLANKTIWW